MEALCQQKDMMNKVNGPIIYYLQKTPAGLNINKDLISRIYKELLLIHSKKYKSKSLQIMEKQCEQVLHQRKTQRMATETNIICTYYGEKY